jgi:hypothetical protein
MPKFEHRPISPVEIYERHGNLAPSTEKLQTMHRQLGDSTKVSTMLVAADMCVDLACVDNDQAGDWISRAENHLDEVIEAGVHLREGGFDRDYFATVPSVVTALMRKFDLGNWLNAAQQKDLEVTYEGALMTADALIPFLHEYPVVNSRTLEFIPVFLGFRALHRQMSDGWFGRLALSREDRRRQNLANHKTNWDAGIAIAGNAADYIKPPIRLQIKSDRKSEASKYKRTGVIMVSAVQCGFVNTACIINSCLIEQGFDTSSNAIDSEILRSDELNAITETIRSRFDSES